MFREQRSAQDEPGECTTGKSAPTRTVRIASLFAGIGGFDRAFELENAEVVFQCEKDRFCQAVLRRHWPDALISDDIRTLTASDIPDADVWTAGFPCQDVSLARGNHGRNGLKGHHTSLFFKLVELVSQKLPTVLLLENVSGLLNSHKGHDFAIILRELTALGYAVAWRVMNARYFGAPQSRPRVFICAWRGDYGRALSTLFEPTRGAKTGPERDGFITERSHLGTGAKVAEIAYCVSATSGRHTGLDWSRSYVSYPGRVRRPTPSESERLQGFPAGWTLPGPGFRQTARGLDSERYRAAGNAVAVPVVRWVAKRLISCLSSGSPLPTAENFYDRALQIAPDLADRTFVLRLEQIKDDLHLEKFTHRWKSGGCASGQWVVEGVASAAPTKPVPSSFVDALDDDIPDDRYFLTPNAAVGILRRAKAVGRNLFRPMRQALEILAEQANVSPSVIGTRSGESIAQSSIRPARSKQRA